MTDPDTPVCLACIGDDDLRNVLVDSAESTRCAFCLVQDSECVSLAQLAATAAPALRAALRPGSVNPHFTIDSDKPEYEQDGEPLSWVLQVELEIDDTLAQALIDELSRQDPADPREGDDPFFDSSQQYERDEASDWGFVEAWREFAQGLKHQQRFFGTDARDRLSSILGAPNSREHVELPRHELDPASRIFRSRRARTAEEARSYLANPTTALGAPPYSAATSGRMNPTGIPVFYGSFSAEVAIAEVRPDVGGIVIAATWTPTRALTLLDLTRIGSSFTGSIFAPEYPRRAARARFLRSFHYLVTRPVPPHEEPLEHVPTQAVAEYVRNELKFDGIVFRSVQQGSVDDSSSYLGTPEERAKELGRCNVVVFPDSAATALIASVEGDITPQKFAEFPLSLTADSAHGVIVTRVEYESDTIDLSDERGFDEGERDF